MSGFCYYLLTSKVWGDKKPMNFIPDSKQKSSGLDLSSSACFPWNWPFLLQSFHLDFQLLTLAYLHFQPTLSFLIHPNFDYFPPRIAPISSKTNNLTACFTWSQTNSSSPHRLHFFLNCPPSLSSQFSLSASLLYFCVKSQSLFLFSLSLPAVSAAFPLLPMPHMTFYLPYLLLALFPFQLCPHFMLLGHW